MKKALIIAGLTLASLAAAQATDVVNQDSRSYKLRVQSEGKLSISNYVIKANTTMYGLCSASFCSFAIPGSKIEAKKDERIRIHHGKLMK
jgi:hypothetical protein